MSNAEIATILGWIAAGIAIGFLVPQIIKVFVTKSVSSLSLITNIITFFGALSWGTYGAFAYVLYHNMQVMITNFTVATMALSLIIYQIVWMKNNKIVYETLKERKTINKMSIEQLKAEISAAKEELKTYDIR